MPVYQENPMKLVLHVSDSKNPVSIQLDCFYGTKASVAFGNDATIVHCGESKIIGFANDLKGTTIVFSGSSTNPEEGQISISHTISEAGGDSISYLFPENYTGSPAFDSNDKRPSYMFNVQFV